MNDNMVVVDTSLAIKWVIPGEVHGEESLSLATDWTRRNIPLLVPSWFACEVTNVLYGRVRDGRFAVADAQANLVVIMAAVEPRDFGPATALRAIEIAHALGQGASYDSQYVALAERLDCELWTADQKFWNAARAQFPRVRWIGAQ